MPKRKVQNVRPAKFHLFPQLPAELRVKIWHMAIESRIIRLITAQVSNRYAWIAKASSLSNLLSINQEARCEPLKRYIMPFSARVFTTGKTSVNHANDLHFNLDHDLSTSTGDTPTALEQLSRGSLRPFQEERNVGISFEKARNKR
jgi:hypothetical protein